MCYRQWNWRSLIISLALVPVPNFLCQTIRWFSLIIKFSFCDSPKLFGATLDSIQFLVRPKHLDPAQNIYGPRRARCKSVHRAVPILWAHLCVLRIFDLIIIIILRHSTGSSECQKIWWGQAYLAGIICSPLTWNSFCFWPRRNWDVTLHWRHTIDGRWRWILNQLSANTTTEKS